MTGIRENPCVSWPYPVRCNCFHRYFLFQTNKHTRASANHIENIFLPGDNVQGEY